jgi:hypothetical protein
MNILLNILITLASLYFSWKELQKAISTRKWFNFLLMVFIPVATLISIYITYKSDIFKDMSLKNANQELDRIKNYNYVSKLGYNGSEQQFFYAMDPNHPIIPSGLPQILIGTYSITGSASDGAPNRIEYKCDVDSQQKYQKAIDFNKNYPFSYYALAVCEKQVNNQEWQSNARKALDIFNITTVIDGHNLWHDLGKKEVEKILGHK